MHFVLLPWKNEFTYLKSEWHELGQRQATYFVGLVVVFGSPPLNEVTD